MLDIGEINTIAHQMSITPEREKKYYFSSPYAYSYYDFFVKNDSPIKNKNDLQLDIATFDGASIENEVIIGRLDALWQGEIKTKTVISDNKLPLRPLDEKLTFEVNAYPFKKTEKGKKLAEEVTKTLDAMRADGTLANLSNKWFHTDTTKQENP